MPSMLIKDHMSPNLVSLRPEMDILQAVNVLCKNSVPGAPVVDQLGNLVGILTEKDCLEIVLNASYHNESGGRVDTLMHKHVETVEANSNITDLAQRLLETHYRGMPVLDDNRLIGMINRSDILRALLECAT